MSRKKSLEEQHSALLGAITLQRGQVHAYCLMTETDLVTRLKSDPAKLAIVARLRRETTLPRGLAKKPNSYQEHPALF